MFSLVVAAVAALALPPPVVGDFDNDGRADRAEVVASGGTHQLVVRRAVEPGRRTVVATLKPEALEDFYLEVLGPGSHITACGKGLGRRDPACLERVDLTGKASLAFGTREASRSVAVWRGDRFEIVALSD